MGIGLVLMPLPAATLPPALALPVFVVLLMLAPVGTALLFPASTSLVSQRTERHELGLMMGAQQTFRGIVSIVGPIGATVAYDVLGAGVPFYLAAVAMVTASLLIQREPRQAPVPATISM
jgi:MFS family permease